MQPSQIPQKPVYLIHAKTKQAKELITAEGGIWFSADVFLHNDNPVDIGRAAKGKDILDDEFVVLEIFVPRVPNALNFSHPNATQLKSLLQELHVLAFKAGRDDDQR